MTAHPHLKKVILWDLDSTISDSRQRRHMLPEEEPPPDFDWVPYALAGEQDEPVVGVVALMHIMHEAGHLNFIVTGRSEQAREGTVRWLKLHGVPYDDLRMNKDREADDNAAFKVRRVEELRKAGYEVILFADDWGCTAEAVHLVGVPTIHVAPPGFQVSGSSLSQQHDNPVPLLK